MCPLSVYEYRPSCSACKVKQILESKHSNDNDEIILKKLINKTHLGGQDIRIDIVYTV